MIFQLGIHEFGQGIDVVDFGLLDVLHTSENVLARFLKFGLIGADLLLDSEVVPPSLGHFGDASIVGKSSVFELLARCLLSY